jgi:hypothetical protein
VKKILRNTLSFLLALSIVLGYMGVTVYKMVCATEQGKTIVSVTNIADECEHAVTQKSACCLPSGKTKPQLQKTDDCCDYSYSLQKIDDTPVTQKTKNSTEHHLNVWVLPAALLPIAARIKVGEQNLVYHAPPIKYQTAQTYLSFIQVYLI